MKTRDRRDLTCPIISNIPESEDGRRFPVKVRLRAGDGGLRRKQFRSDLSAHLLCSRLLLESGEARISGTIITQLHDNLESIQRSIFDRNIIQSSW